MVELGKILYAVVFMTFLNTNGSIVSFEKKKKKLKYGDWYIVLWFGILG